MLQFPGATSWTIQSLKEFSTLWFLNLQQRGFCGVAAFWVLALVSSKLKGRLKEPPNKIIGLLKKNFNFKAANVQKYQVPGSAGVKQELPNSRLG